MLLACRAPSVHNSQPWRWIADGVTLQLWADPTRAMPATDHTGRELLLSCGAVLDHLRVAMAAAGWASATRRFPDPDNPDHLATLQFQPAEVTGAQQLRANAITRRRTDRLPFEAPRPHGRPDSQSYAARCLVMTCCSTWWPTNRVPT